MSDTPIQGAPRLFKDAVVLITGGGSGVGFACAKLYGQAGANIIIVGRSEDKLQQATDDLKKRGITAIYLAGSVDDAAFAEKTMHHILTIFGKLDILINAAGIILRKEARDTSDEEWRQIMATNVDGVFYFSRAAAAAIGKNGAIVNVSSTCGLVGCTGLAAYNTSKGAVIQLTRSMALELAPAKITVNAVAPGAIESDMLYSKHKAGTNDEDVRHNNLAAIPIGTIAMPEEVARSIVFLSQEKHITGSILSIDGGYTAQ